MRKKIKEKYLEKIQDFQWFWLLRLMARDVCEESLKNDGEFEEELPYEYNGILGIMVKTKSFGEMSWGKNDLIKRFAIKNNELGRIQI